MDRSSIQIDLNATNNHNTTNNNINSEDDIKTPDFDYAFQVNSQLL